MLNRFKLDFLRSILAVCIGVVSVTYTNFSIAQPSITQTAPATPLWNHTDWNPNAYIQNGTFEDALAASIRNVKYWNGESSGCQVNGSPSNVRPDTGDSQNVNGVEHWWAYDFTFTTICPSDTSPRFSGTLTYKTIYTADWKCPVGYSTPIFKTIASEPNRTTLEAYCERQVAIPPQLCPAPGSTPNPILPATGEKIKLQTDYTDSAPHSLDFTRTYRTAWGDVAPASGMGSNWNHRFGMQLTNVGGAAASTTSLSKTLQMPDGSQRRFTRGSTTLPWVNTDGTDQLVENAAGHLFTSAQNDESWQFNTVGKPTTLTQRNGWAYTLAYNPSGQLIRNWSVKSSSHPTAKCWPPLVSTIQSDSGVFRTGMQLRRSAAIKKKSEESHFHRTANCWFRPATTVQHVCGIQAPENNWE